MHQKEKIYHCYLTGDKITPENSSLEHIIPNALGGVIKNRNILSKQANKKLSHDIDNKFNEIFAGIHRRFSILGNYTAFD